MVPIHADIHSTQVKQRGQPGLTNKRMTFIQLDILTYFVECLLEKIFVLNEFGMKSIFTRITQLVIGTIVLITHALYC